MMPAQNNVSKSPTIRRRNQNQSNAANDSNANSSASFTEEQLEAVERIRKCKDYYEILGVSKDAGESELRKQYKKLALQFHPDKNKAPGAVEAFKAIGNAFSILNDPVKRKRYDEYGLEAIQQTESFPQEGYYSYAHTFEGDVTPEEVYHMFFHGHTFVRRGSQWQRYHTRSSTVYQQDSRSTMMQILPLLLIISVSLLSSFFVSDPPYNLQKTAKYAFEQKTSNLDVPYYVQENFLSEYKSRIAHIERQVEEEYIINTRTSCFRERNYKENMIWRAKHFKDISLETKARELRTPSCDILNQLYRTVNDL